MRLLLQRSGGGPFLVLFKSHVIVLNRLRKISFAILSSTSGIGSINMVRIQRQDFRKVLNGDVSLFQFVIRTSHDVQRTDIEFV